MKRTFLSSYINHMFEKGPGVYHCLVRKIAKRRKDNGVIMTGNIWIEFGLYLNTRGQFVTCWCRQTQRNICGSSVQLNIEKYLVANYMSFSTDKPWASCQLLKLWYSLESKQMGSVCLGIPQEISYFRTTAVGWDPFATTKLSPSHCRPQPGINENSAFTLCPQVPLSVWPIPRCFNLAVFIKSTNTKLHFNQELQWNNLNCWPRWCSWSRWLLSPIQPKIFYSTLLPPYSILS